MIVIRKDLKEATKFEELLPGAVFEYDGDVYMKTYLPSRAVYKAVELEGGFVENFATTTKVIPLDAEVIVKGERK